MEVEEQALQLCDVVTAIRYKIPREMHTHELPKWLEWFGALDSADSPVRLVSWIELLMHFQATTSCIGVVCQGKGQHRNWIAVTNAATYGYDRLAKSFAQYGWNMLRVFRPGWKVIRTKPTSYRVQYTTSSIPIRISSRFEQIVETHFHACQVDMLRQVKDVAKLSRAMEA